VPRRCVHAGIPFGLMKRHVDPDIKRYDWSLAICSDFNPLRSGVIFSFDISAPLMHGRGARKQSHIF